LPSWLWLLVIVYWIVGLRCALKWIPFRERSFHFKNAPLDSDVLTWVCGLWIVFLVALLWPVYWRARGQLWHK